MPYTIQNAKQDLEGMVHSTSLNKIRNLNALFQRAGRTLLTKIDPPDTIRIAQISNAIHTDVFDYTAPSDLKGNSIVDIRPQVNRQESDKLTQKLSEEFDLTKANNTFQIRYNSGVKSLRLSKAITPSSITLHNCNSLTSNGTWAADGAGAKNLTLDTLDYWDGGASLNFDLDKDTTTGYLEISDMSDIDLEDEDERGIIFVMVYIPDTTLITNFILRWGNDSSNYWSVTVTSPHDQSTFKTGWQILAFNWNGATETGTVTPTAIDYLRLTVTYSTAADETDLRLDKISCSRGEIWEIEYYSECLFRTSGGTWQTTTSNDTDIINLDEDGYNLYLYECLKLIAQQLQGEDSVFDINFSNMELIALYNSYLDKHPSQVKKPRQLYYRAWLYSR